jgi:hypothetical protein
VQPVRGERGFGVEDCLIQRVPLKRTDFFDGRIGVLLPARWKHVDPLLPTIPLNIERLGDIESEKVVGILPRIDERANIVGTVPGDAHDVRMGKDIANRKDTEGICRTLVHESVRVECGSVASTDEPVRSWSQVLTGEHLRMIVAMFWGM